MGKVFDFGVELGHKGQVAPIGDGLTSLDFRFNRDFKFNRDFRFSMETLGSNRTLGAKPVRQLSEIVEGGRVSALIDLDYSERGTVKLMNYHQTKGQEADTVVHVFGPDDYFGSEVEPFEKTSRLLNVAISRARHRVIVVLPPTPHPLVEPFTLLRRYARDD